MADRSRGRPRGTSRRALELVALELFTEQGYEATTIEEIATAAGVSRRTFFRYFDSKADVLWYDFDAEILALRATLDETPDDVEVAAAIRAAVIEVNRYTADDVGELRTRMKAIAASPALQAVAALRYDRWERVVTEFAARRRGLDPDDLWPLVVGRTTLAACRGAFERWTEQGDEALTGYLDRALRMLEAGTDAGADR